MVDERTREKLGIVEEKAAGYLEAMRFYNVAEFSTSVDAEKKSRALENLAKQGKISLVLNVPGSSASSKTYSRKVPEKEGRALSYTFSSSLINSPQELKVWVYSQENIYKALDDFGALTNFYPPESTNRRERPKEDYEKRISKEAPTVIYGAPDWGDLTR
jgi:hypothetical protein